MVTNGADMVNYIARALKSIFGHLFVLLRKKIDQRQFQSQVKPTAEIVVEIFSRLFFWTFLLLFV